MKERFQGANRPRLIEALKRNDFSLSKADVAAALADKGELIEFGPGENIITQKDNKNDVYFLIAGVVGIIVNGAQIATRNAGQHVGEMSAIEPSLPRATTVTVLEKVLALKLSSADFMTIGEGNWLPVAQELARRLYQRNTTIRPANPSPKLFIISSSEAKKIAYAMRSGLEHDVFSTVWDQGVFFAGGYPLEALEKQVSESDFAVAIAEPDDMTESRGVRAQTVRDNVLFELGLFMGKLTRYRTLLVHPRVKELKLPSDLQGLTLVAYEPGDESTLVTRIAPACEAVREVVKRLGVRTFTVESS